MNVGCNIVAGQQPRPFGTEERAAIAFFEKHRGGAQAKIDGLIAQYGQASNDAERAAIQNLIDDHVDFWVEKIRDWASD